MGGLSQGWAEESLARQHPRVRELLAAGDVLVKELLAHGEYMTDDLIERWAEARRCFLAKEGSWR